MDLVTRYLEKKRRRLDEIALEVARLQEQLAALGQEEAKVRTQIETAEEMADELAEEAASLKPSEPKVARQRKKRQKPAKQTGVTLVDAIRRATQSIPAPFTTGDVKAWLHQEYPELVAHTHFSSIAGTMRRMAVKGHLTAVEKGGPGKEASYSLPQDVQQPHPGHRVDEQPTIFEGV